MNSPPESLYIGSQQSQKYQPMALLVVSLLPPGNIPVIPIVTLVFVLCCSSDVVTPWQHHSVATIASFFIDVIRKINLAPFLKVIIPKLPHHVTFVPLSNTYVTSSLC
jgi:hypothetical protein